MRIIGEYKEKRKKEPTGSKTKKVKKMSPLIISPAKIREKDIRSPHSKIGSLKKILDQKLSRLIREHEKKCCTCGATTNLQNGHFRSRRFFSTRYNPLNCHAQCVGCNVFKFGMSYEYSLWLDETYGADTAAKLKTESEKIKQWNHLELIELIEATKKGYYFYRDTYNRLSTV